VVALGALIAISATGFRMGPEISSGSGVSSYELANAVSAAFSAKQSKGDVELRVKSVGLPPLERPQLAR